MIYRLLIVAATVIWGSSFVIVKDVTTYLTPGWLLALRFFGAALILALVFMKYRGFYLKKDHILFGAVFGTALFLGYYVQTWGLTFTTPGKNAFLTGTYCVMVPFLAWVLIHRKPTSFNIVAAFLCIVGVGLISLGNEGGVNIGDVLTLICAVFYAVHIILVGKFAEGRNIYVLTMWQFFFVGVWSAFVGLVFEPAPTVLAALDSSQIIALVYLTVACTALALLFQNIGQANIPPASASLLLSLESPFGVFFSVLAGAELLSGQMVMGFVFVFAAIVVSEYLPVRMGQKEIEDALPVKVEGHSKAQ